jgi:hypothetical protein
LYPVASASLAAKHANSASGKACGSVVRAEPIFSCFCHAQAKVEGLKICGETERNETYVYALDDFGIFQYSYHFV